MAIRSTNKSQIKARQYFLVITTIVILLPLTMIVTYLVIMRPKTIQNSTNSNTRTNSNIVNKDSLKGVIKDDISFNYTKPDINWSHKLVKKEQNPYDKLKSYQYEFTNGKSKINFLVVEEDLLYQKYAVGNPNYISNELNSKLYGYVESSPESVEIYVDKGRSEISRIYNSRLGSGQIFVDKKNSKDKKFQSNLQLFIDYREDFRNQTFYVQITYDNDTPENYKAMDSLVKTITYTKLGTE